MSDVARYVAAGDGVVKTDIAGPLVKWNDYARLQAEVVRLKSPVYMGGYNLSEYIRMANSETLEFDNGDIFAGMTIPERIKYIVESHARLKAEVERLRASSFVTAVPVEEYEKLKVENERLTQEYSDATNHYNKLHNDLRAEVERLRKAGDAMLPFFIYPPYEKGSHKAVLNWNAAKEGKQP